MEGWVNLSGGPTHSQVDLVSLSEVDRLTSRPNQSSPVQSSNKSYFHHRPQRFVGLFQHQRAPALALHANLPSACTSDPARSCLVQRKKKINNKKLACTVSDQPRDNPASRKVASTVGAC